MDPRAIPVASARVDGQHGRPYLLVNEQLLMTPGGVPVEPASDELAEEMAWELMRDGMADVTLPSLYAFYSTQCDFIDPAPARTVDALIELLEHDYLLHPDSRLGMRQMQVAAWGPQIELWQRVVGREPPCASPYSDSDIPDAAYAGFRRLLAGFSPAQLTVAIQSANLLKSVTLGILLAQRSIDADTAIEAVAVTLRLMAGDMHDELERQDEREESWGEAVNRLLRYAEVSEGS
ncbi:MAG: hypothetical protein ACR2PL_17495 [Dehalococcoidia bacterium]